MKKYTTIIIALAIGILSGCNKDKLSTPNADVTGIWAGTWSGDIDTDYGEILIEVVQNGSNLEGELFLMSGSNLQNEGTDIEGTVYGDEINIRQTSGSENSFNGEVVNNTISGRVKYGADWNATKIPSGELKILNTFECPGEFPKYIAVDDKNIWVYDGYDSSIIQLSKLTGVEEGKLVDFDPWDSDYYYARGIASDGTYIYWSYHQQITKVLISNPGTPKDFEVINTPEISNLSNLFFDGKYFHVVDGIGDKAYKLSKSGTLLSTIDMPGLCQGIISDGTDIWMLQSSPNILSRYNEDDKLVEAYRLPNSLNNRYSYHDLSHDGQNFWVLVNQSSTNPSPSNPDKYYLYELGK